MGCDSTLLIVDIIIACPPCRNRAPDATSVFREVVDVYTALMAREQGLFAGAVGDCASAAMLLRTDADEVLVVAGNVRDSPRVSISEQPRSSTATMPMAAVASIMVANHRLSLIIIKAELQHRLLLRPLGAASVISRLQDSSRR